MERLLGLLLMISVGGGAAYYYSRNRSGYVPTATPGVRWTWAVDGGLQGAFRATVQSPVGGVVDVGTFDTFDAARAAALERIATAIGGPGLQAVTAQPQAGLFIGAKRVG